MRFEHDKLPPPHHWSGVLPVWKIAVGPTVLGSPYFTTETEALVYWYNLPADERRRWYIFKRATSASPAWEDVTPEELS